jgi:hypothetical protein
MADDDLWRRRFQLFMLVRFIGLATFFLGIAIIYSDLVREGGWPALGAVLAILGTLDAVFAPRMLKKLWDQEDGRRP